MLTMDGEGTKDILLENVDIHNNEKNGEINIIVRYIEKEHHVVSKGNLVEFHWTEMNDEKEE